MTSKELNDAIRSIENDDDVVFEIEGLEDTGKSIPYIGWFWREVDFDTLDESFGIIPGEFIGFMENNKWDHDYADATEDEWKNIKELLEVFVTEQTNETGQAVFDAIQGVKG